MESISIAILISIVGCFIGIAGWLSGRDKKIANDSEWRGEINTKLNMILGIDGDVKKMNIQVQEHETRITVLEKGRM